MTDRHEQLVHIVILASGTGSNAGKIMEFFQDSEMATVSAVLTNNPHAGVLEKAAKAGVTGEIMPRFVYADGDQLVSLLRSFHADLVVLAGYLKLIPREVVKAFEGRIVNIHPALLPDYGGKGMYGANVHKAVLAAGDKYSGITIHLVNEEYDKGDILFQKKVEIKPDWGPGELQQAIHELEHAFFPSVINGLVKQILAQKENNTES